MKLVLAAFLALAAVYMVLHDPQRGEVIGRRVVLGDYGTAGGEG